MEPFVLKNKRVLWILPLLLASNVEAQTYAKRIGEVGRDERASVVHSDPQGNLFIAGSINDSALVQRVDEVGNILWSVRFRPPGSFPKHVYHLESAPDGSLIGCGNGISGGDEPFQGFHFRMDINGNVLWVRNWDGGIAYNRRIKALSNDVYLLFSDYFASNGTRGDLFQARVDALTGDVIWISDRHDLYSTNPYIDDIIGTCSTPYSHYGVGRLFTGGSSLARCRVFVNKYSYDGNLLWTKYLIYSNSDNRRMYGTDIVHSNDSLALTYFGDVTGASGNFTVGLIRTDTLGNVAWAKNYNIVGNAQEVASRILATSFGYLIVGRTNSNNQRRTFLIAVSNTGNVLWAKRYGNVGDVHDAPHFYTTNLASVADGFVLCATQVNGANEDIMLYRTDIGGNIECDPPEDLEVTTTNLPTQSFIPVVEDIPFSLTMAPGVTTAQTTTIPSDCPALIDLGNDTSSCAPVTLAPSLPGATYSWQDGSTSESYEAVSSGVYWVDVTVGCCTDRDSITVVISSPSAGIDLGADTVLCPGEELLLSTGAIGQGHSWSDGSSGEELLVSEPGIYWVSVGTAPCNSVDTILVEHVDIEGLELGPDTTLCDGGSVLLEIPDGVSNGVWQDGSVSDAIWITESGSYSFTAEYDGCLVADSIEVQFTSIPLVDLGPDTVLCTGLDLFLVVGLGLPLEWQDGSTSDSLQIGASGFYWVVVGQDGCTASDTISVDLLPAPVVDLGPDTLLCEGEQLLLQVDSGYAMYTWQDGSGLPSLSISGTGTYSVTVTDQGCTGLDSIEVVFVAPPLFDLGPNLAACEDDVLTLGTGLTGTPHLWQDGTTFDSLVVTVSGTYWVQVGAPGCLASDTVQVDFTPIPVLELGPDTTLCSGTELLLEVVLGQANITWQDGTSLPEYTITEGGMYWAVVELLGCTANDTITVGFVDPPVVDLGPDLSVCAGDDTELGTGLQGLPHLWQDGTTAEVLQAVSSGTYWVVVGPVGCSGTDTVSVEVIPIPVIALGEDTLLCGSVQLVLTSGYPAVNSTWQDGTQAATFTVTGPGVYSVAVDVQGCTGSASITVSVGALPYLTIPGDTLLCNASSVLLTAQAASGDVVIWQDGSSGPSYLAQGSGVFTASVGNACGTVSDSVRVSVAAPFMVPDRYLVCFGESARIDWADQVVSVAWSNGSVEVDPQLPEGGYTYTAVDASGCQREGAVLVYSDTEADGSSYIPNVFTPNGDGFNELFTVVGADRAGFSMEIFNRWGELLFETNDPDQGWNGKYDGSDAPDGTYIYVVQYSATCGERGSVNTIGHVTLLR